MLISNHNKDATEGKISGQLTLEHICGFCKSFEKITKGLGFHITFKTADLRDVLYTLGNNITEKIEFLNLLVPTILPVAETRRLFSDSIKNSFNLSIDEWVTGRRVGNSALEYQVVIGSSQNK